MLKRTFLTFLALSGLAAAADKYTELQGLGPLPEYCREIDQREDGRGRETLGTSLVAGPSDYPDVSVGFSDGQETENHGESCFAVLTLSM